MPLINSISTDDFADLYSDHATYDHGKCHLLADSIPELIEGLQESRFSLVLDLDLDRVASTLINKQIDWFDFLNAVESSYQGRSFAFVYEGSAVFCSLKAEDAHRTYALFPVSTAQMSDTGETIAQLVMFAVTHKAELDTAELYSIIQKSLSALHKNTDPA